MDDLFTGYVVLQNSDCSITCTKESETSKAYYCVYGCLDREAFIEFKNLPDPETYWKESCQGYLTITEEGEEIYEVTI